MSEFTTKPRFSWRARRGGFSSPDTYELVRNGSVMAVAQRVGNLWFSYGMAGVIWNTSNKPASLDEVKQDAIQRARAALRDNGRAGE